MINNKKGAAGLTVLAIMLAIVAILVFAGGVYWLGQSVVGTPAATAATQQVITESKIGDPSTLRIYCKDLESDAKSNVAAGIYVYNSGKGILVADNTTASATARTSVSASIGDKLDVYCFGSSYYGEKLAWEIKSGNEQIDVPTHAYGGMNITFSNDAGTVLSSAGGVNITLAASETSTWSKAEFKNANANSLFKVGMVLFNFSAATNIDNLEILGWDKASQPSRLTGVSRVFAFTPPAGSDTALTQYEKLITGAIKVKAKGSNPAEFGSIFVIDKDVFKSSAAGTYGQLLEGFQTDASSPGAVGIPDWVEIVNIE